MIIYTDGSYKTSQQNSNSEEVELVSAFYHEDKTEIKKINIKRNPALKQYSNLAEWISIGMAVDYALEQGEEELLIKTDSRVCVAWMRHVYKGEYRSGKKGNGKIKSFATKNHQEVFDYLVEMNKKIDIKLEWVPRDKNIIGVILENEGFE